ncbi:MAG: beta-galactosidase [Clostridia bacterium]|nr:beta-galactosidase [Clostridia bacterium]
MKKMKRVTATLLIAMMVGSMMPAFVANAATTDTSIEGWTATVNNADGGAYIDRSEGVRGKASVKLVNKSPRTSREEYVAFAQKLNGLKKGKTYRLEFEAKVQNGKTCDVMFNWSPRWSLIPIKASYDWTPFQFSYTPTADGSADLRFILDNKTDALWIDNIKVYDTAEPNVNLLKNGNFEDVVGGPTEADEKEAAVETLASPNYFPVRGTMTVDGDVSDWGGIEGRKLAQVNKFIANAPVTTSGTVKYAYDDEKLYLLFEIIDPTHVADEESFYKGDSMQFSTAAKKGDSGNEKNVALWSDSIYKNKETFDIAITREGTKTIYEASMLWSEDFGGEVPDEMLFNAVVNNNDGSGRAYCIELTDGISSSKNTSMFNWMYFKKPVGDLEYCVEIPDSVVLGDDASMVVHLSNPGVGNASAEIVSQVFGYKQTVTLAGGQEKKYAIPFPKDKAGDVVVDMTITSGGETITKEKKVNILYNLEAYQVLKQTLNGYAEELRNLIYKCQQKGMNPVYEVALHSIIVKQIETMEDEVSWNQKHGWSLFRFAEYEKQLTELYEEAKADLTAYLKGEKKPLTIPQYVTSDITMDGVSMIAETFDGTKTEERPTFFVGSMCIDYSNLEQMEFLSTIGFNTVQLANNPFKFMVGFDPHIIQDWSKWQYGNANVTFTITDEAAAVGKKSLKITNTDVYKNDNYKELRQYVPAKPNTTYEWGFKSKGKNMDWCWFGMDGRVGRGYQYVQPSEDWKNNDFTYTTGDNQYFIEYAFACEGKTDELFLDDLYIREKGTTVNLLENASFEDDSVPEKTDIDQEMAEKYGWYVDYGSLELKRARKFMEEAERYNIAVDLLIGIDHAPRLFLNVDENLEKSKTQFLGYTIQRQAARDYVVWQAAAMLNIAKDYTSVKSICLSNEPTVNSYNSDYYLPLFQGYLNELYGGDIAVLNRNYGTEYASFEEVPLPAGQIEETSLYYDWRQFNDGLLYDFFDEYSKRVRAQYPQFDYHAKVMNYFRYDYDHHLKGGSNYEWLAELFDYNGCDAHSYLTDQGKTPMPLKMGWYDFMTSVKDAPVLDTETHIVHDGQTTTYEDIRPKYFESDVWNGAIHGRTNIILWNIDSMGPKATYNWSTYVESNLLLRPKTLAKISDVVMDLNRLAYEVTALQKAEHKTGLLYSRTNLTRNKKYMTMVGDVYKQLLFSGQKVTMITDTEPEKMNDYQLLVVPEVKYVTNDVLMAVKNYIEKGGKVLLVGDDCFKYNEYGLLNDTEVVEYIYANVDRQSSVYDKVVELGLSDVVLKDAETGKPISGVEYSYTEYNGKILVNLLNYDFDNSYTFHVYYQGKEVTEFTELRGMEKVSGTVTVKPYQPILLQFEK